MPWENDAPLAAALPPFYSTSLEMTDAQALPLYPHRHLLGIQGLSPPDIELLLDRADAAVALSRQPEKKIQPPARPHPDQPLLRSLDPHAVLVRARRQAARRRRDEHVGRQSSVKKGETLIDTAMTLNAMRPDILVIRHSSAGAAALLAQKVACSVVNAGDGAHEHPTQALLDALTIRRAKGPIAGLTVAICGDILHSRVARSNILLLNALGARVRVVAPSTLLPTRASPIWAWRCSATMAEGLKDADVVMMLRLQRERMEGPSCRRCANISAISASTPRS
jgi:aspartate carbamoyltransferase catalytic subunit